MKKLVDSVITFQERSLEIVNEMRQLSTQNSAEIRDAVEDGKRRIARLVAQGRPCRSMADGRAPGDEHGAARSAAASGSPAPAPQKLDELMLAMDVVDTLRHQENLVARELDETRREASLIERLRQIYRGQGIEVPDRVLAGGRAGAQGKPLRLYPAAARPRPDARPGVGQPRPGRQGAARPSGARPASAGARIRSGWCARRSSGPSRRARKPSGSSANSPTFCRAPWSRAIRRSWRKRGWTRRASGPIKSLPTAARRSRAGTRRARRRPSATWRNCGPTCGASTCCASSPAPASRPASGASRPATRSARNYYVVVEPVAPDGRILSLPVTSEEDGRTQTVSKWAVRVSEDVFNQVRRDKNDDGIVQRNRLGEKRRGYLDVDYLMPVLGGAILSW